MNGKVPSSFLYRITEPGIYIAKHFPKDMKFTVNGKTGESFQLDKGTYKIVITNPIGAMYSFTMKLLLSNEQRQKTVEEMKMDIANE